LRGEQSLRRVKRLIAFVIPFFAEAHHLLTLFTAPRW
jgi:hypothetical protein